MRGYGPSWEYINGNNKQAFGEFDAKDGVDENDIYDGDLSSWYLFHISIAPVPYFKNLIPNIVGEIYDGNKQYAFLDPNWSPPNNWEADASDFASVTFNHDNEVIKSSTSPSTRYSIPGKSFFKFISDAQYARPLRRVSYDNGDSSSSTITIYVPPYDPWYDPDSGNTYYEIGGKRVGLLGRFQGSLNGNLHTLPAFRFTYSGYHNDDPPTALDKLNGSFTHLGYLRSVPDNCICSYTQLNQLIPKLNTETSWWEEEGLSDEAIENIDGPKVIENLRNFYVPPSITPILRVFDSNNFPPNDGWIPSEGSINKDFISPFPFAQSIQHAQSFLSKLKKVVIPIGNIRTYFSAQAHHKTIKTNDIVEDSSSDPGEVYEYAVAVNGWRDCGISNETYIDESYPDGLSFKGMKLWAHLPGKQCSYSETKTNGEVFDHPYRTHTQIIKTQYNATCSYTISKIIPLADQSTAMRFDWTYNGDSGTTASGDELQITTLIPTWANRFIKSISLYFVCEGVRNEVASNEGGFTCEVTYGSPTIWSGSVTKSKGGTRHKRVIKLPGTWDPSICGFTLDNFDLWDFMDSIIGADGLVPSGYYISPGEESDITTYKYEQNSQVGYTREYKYDYKRGFLNRVLENVSLFMVVEFDPDVDTSWPS